MKTPVLVAFALSAVLFGASASAQTTWKMATKMPPDGPEGKVFQYFADQVEKHSGGKVKVQVFPNEQLGKEAAVLEQLKLGTVQLYAEGSTFLEKWVPEIRWTSSAFLFKDRGHWVRFMNSPMVSGWFDEAKKKAGIGMLGDQTGVLRGPYRVLLAQQPVATPADLAKVKLRMANSKSGVEQWKHLGAEVRVLGWAETYESIGRGVVNAVTSPIALVESMKFYEVAKHITRTDEYWQSIAFMMNQKAFDALGKPEQQALLAAQADAAAYSAKLMKDVVDESIGRMKAKGAVYHEVDLAPFIDRMQAYYRDYEKKGELPKGFMETVASTAR
ncbi:MAG: TRAP transporter substrate-binding protein [Lautropia sp.]